MRSKPKHGTSFYGQQPRVPNLESSLYPCWCLGTEPRSPAPIPTSAQRLPAASAFRQRECILAGYSGKHFRPAFCLRHSRMTSEKSVCLSATSSGSCYWPPWWWRSFGVSLFMPRGDALTIANDLIQTALLLTDLSQQFSHSRGPLCTTCSGTMHFVYRATNHCHLSLKAMSTKN